MARGRSPNRAYLVRCWWEADTGPDGKPGWRFSLEEVLSERHQRGFGSLEALFAFLQAELADERGCPPHSE
jgi:hypothetical protein